MVAQTVSLRVRQARVALSSEASVVTENGQPPSAPLELPIIIKKAINPTKVSRVAARNSAKTLVRRLL